MSKIPTNKFEELVFFDCGYTRNQIARLIKVKNVSTIITSPWTMSLEQLMPIAEVTSTPLEKMFWIVMYDYWSSKKTYAGTMAAESIRIKKLS